MREYSFVERYVFGLKFYSDTEIAYPVMMDMFEALLLNCVVIMSLRYVVEKIGWHLGWILLNFNRPKFAKTNPEKAHKKMLKFQIQLWKLFYHAIVSGVAYYYFCDQPWWLWKGATASGYTGFTMRKWTHWYRWYYNFQFSYHFSSTVHHFFETHRDDHVQMIIHHAVTLVLVFGSYWATELPCGIVVFFIHDISDVTTSWAKLVNYVYSPIWIIAPSYLLLFLAWAYWRIWTFWSQLLSVLYFHQFQCLALWIYEVLLHTLWLLHWYWWYQITMVGYFIIKGSEEIDVNEDRSLLDNQIEKKKDD